jgi:hypothetical protein
LRTGFGHKERLNWSERYLGFGHVIGYLVFSVILAVVCATFTTVFLDGTLLVVVTAYFVGGYAGFLGYLTLVLLADGRQERLASWHRDPY